MKKKLLAFMLCVLCVSSVLLGCGGYDFGKGSDSKKNSSGKTDAETYVTDYKDQLDKVIDQTLQTYSATYSNVEIKAEGNSVLFIYTCKPGVVIKQENLDKNNSQAMINSAKLSDEKATGLSFDTFEWVYIDSKGKEQARVISNN